MKMRSALILVGASMSLGLLAATLPASAAAKSSAMQSCSDDWSKMKSANKVPDGQTWPKFWSQCSKDYASAHPDDGAAAAAAPAAAPAAKSAAKTAAAPAAADAKAAGKSTAMASCSDDWAKLKAANKVPSGQTWPKFWSQCSKDYAAANPDGAAAAPAAKTGKAKAAATDDELGMALPDPDAAAKLDTSKTAAGKKPMTAGQQAAVVRIRACGAEWQDKKKAGTLPQGAKWPQYWSDCNKRLKAKGQ
ncbi:MAG: hypothetical protein P0Y66_06525 [Candidatus Kaistia colombiensis]|nr:MAG: hypothetical protein P0Y66_06525 [Kaistia sp.]